MSAHRSEGVWQAAWRRFRGDRVGLVSMVVVLAFLVLIALAALGAVASGWQQEVGVPNAPPTWMGPRAPESAGVAEAPGGPPVDLSDIDPLAPRYAEWAERTKAYQAGEAPRAQTLPLGGDRLGRDVLDKAIKGTEVSVFVGVLAALLATAIGTLLGALAGYFGGKVGDFLEVFLENLSPKDRTALLKAAPLTKGELNAAQKLEAAAKKFEKELKNPKLQKPSQIYQAIAKTPGEVVLYLSTYSEQRIIQDRIKNYFSKYLPAAQEITDEMVVESGVPLASPKFKKAKEEMMLKRLDARPKKVEPVPEAPPTPPMSSFARGPSVRTMRN